ncbi:GatB/YqeY domain-containing protein [Fervidobacterium nodosum]|uniref:GatB/Yqey domain protein n=1 Tax=Fervidobacterium nodosum (strain ATCC 35602 / DSM 5306 / Rt17-B1) TaxID=381764 RepID=A7HL58_FERNB|nr:GatB/YqeY domain-containing protein [Fervidobacterium nodosum]ABS60641.1 GatB/Yqey domain protein [Fervidobacterium nodosum Rt17-B1]PHJ13640.1 glutamyl-tRNA amidotransferase [Fervidobacterium sp. SC_NGM5_G05]
MSLKEKILSDMKEAMKNKDELRLRVLRSIKTAIGYFEVEGEKREATDEDIQKIILKEIKKRQESIEAYRQAGREDLANAEQEELSVLQEYAPKMLSKEEIQEIVKQIVQELGATKNDFGKVMKEAMTRLKGSADGKIVNEVVKEMLS